MKDLRKLVTKTLTIREECQRENQARGKHKEVEVSHSLLTSACTHTDTGPRLPSW